MIKVALYMGFLPQKWMKSNKKFKKLSYCPIYNKTHRQPLRCLNPDNNLLGF
jgi:hypothetical protein